MKTVVLTVFWAAAASLVISKVGAADNNKGGAVTVYAINGSARVSSGNSDSKPLKPGQQVSAGSTITTGQNSSVDLVMPSSGSAVRVNPGSTLDVNKASSTLCGDQFVTDCDFNLKSGSVTGCTGKLPTSSKFCFDNDHGHNHCQCSSTQYEINANGDVTVLSGKISLDYDSGKKNDKGDEDNVMVSAGQTFDPKTGKVVTTTSQDLKNIIDVVKTMKDITDSFKVDGATITVFTEGECSPVKPPHDHDHDHDHNHDHDHDHDHDNNGHDNNGHDHGDQGDHGHDGYSSQGHY